MMARSGGSENISLRSKGRCLNVINAGPAASMASMIGALKPGTSVALTDRAKQKVVMVSMVKQRNAKNKSDGLPAR